MFKLFSKKKESVDLKFDDVREFIEVRTEKESSDEEKRIKGIVDDVMNEIGKLKLQFEELKELDSDNSFSLSIKNKYCDRFLEMISFDTPGISFSELNKFAEKIGGITKSASNLTVKEFKHMRGFRAKMGRVSLQTKIIDKKLKILRGSMKKSVLEKKDKMMKCITWVNEIREKISAIDNEMGVMGGKKAELENEIRGIDSELDGFEKNGLQERFDHEMKEVGILEKERDMIKQQIETEFGGIIRPLKRLQYASDSGEAALLDAEKKALEQYLLKPDTFLSDNENIIRSLINQTKALSEKGVIELNDKENDKISGVFGNLNFLISSKTQCNNLMTQIREKEKKIRDIYMPFAEKKKTSQNEKKKKMDDIHALEDSKKTKDEEKEKLRKKIASDISALEIMMKENLDVDAKINYQ